MISCPPSLPAAAGFFCFFFSFLFQVIRRPYWLCCFYVGYTHSFSKTHKPHVCVCVCVCVNNPFPSSKTHPSLSLFLSFSLFLLLSPVCLQPSLPLSLSPSLPLSLSPSLPLSLSSSLPLSFPPSLPPSLPSSSNLADIECLLDRSASVVDELAHIQKSINYFELII